MTCLNETKKTKQKNSFITTAIYINLYSWAWCLSVTIWEEVFKLSKNLFFLFGFLVHFLSYSDSLFILQAVCAFICCQISRNRPESIFTRLIFTTTVLFLLCLNPYLWAQCLWATFSGFKIISSAYETTFCDWLSRPMKMIFIPKSFSKEKQK